MTPLTRSDSGADHLCNYSSNHRGRSTSLKNRKHEPDLVVSKAGAGAAGAPGSLGDQLPCRAGRRWLPLFRKRAPFILRHTQHLLQKHVFLGLEKEKEGSSTQTSDNQNSDKERRQITAIVHASELPVQSNHVLCSTNCSVWLSPLGCDIPGILVTIRVIKLAICPCGRARMQSSTVT